MVIQSACFRLKPTDLPSSNEKPAWWHSWGSRPPRFACSMLIPPALSCCSTWINGCGFSGTLPTQIGQASLLQTLYVRGTTAGLEAVTNRFSGTLPTEIGKLHSVRHVALNDNRISGSIPAQIATMHSLTSWELQVTSPVGAVTVP